MPDYLDVCCRHGEIRQTPTESIEAQSISIKCGVAHPNGVGFKIKKILDHEAEFGNFNLSIK